MLFLYKEPPRKCSAGNLNSIMLVVALAVGWHIGITWLARSRMPAFTKPSLPRLLRLAELDLLSALRGELTRRLHAKHGLQPRHKQKLREVDAQIKKLEESNAD